MAAEIAVEHAVGAGPSGRFNEAAANGRGNQTQKRDGVAAAAGFNEAAANGRGNPSNSTARSPR